MTFNIEKYIPTPEFVLKRKIESSHRYALSYLILLNQKREKPFITTAILAQKLNKSYTEAWNILMEFANLGFLIQRKTASKMKIFIIKDEFIDNELIAIAQKTLES